jgi:elongation of very long chain fatty acids protein 4
MADIQNPCEAKCYKVNFIGTQRGEIMWAFVMKTLHFSWLFGIPFYLHGVSGVLFSLVVVMVGSFWTALLFIISHNLEACKPGYQMSKAALEDWAVWQIETSASWGGPIVSFLTGGLNFQIEHHLLPCVPHHLYGEISLIVQEECSKAGIRYNRYESLYSIGSALVSFLKAVGEKPQQQMPKDSASTVSSLVNQASIAAEAAKSAGTAAVDKVAFVASEMSEVNISKTAKEMVQSATDVQKHMGTKEHEGYARLMKPVMFAVLYQAAQEWYTQTWTQSSMDWHNTTMLKPAIFTLIYGAMIMIGNKVMEHREPNPRLRKYMLTYNLYQVVLNGWCVFALIQEVVMRHSSLFSFTVEESSYKLAFLIWVHYNNKFIELFDTFFMVANKKKEQISFLHVYHHMLIMWSWWAVCKYGCGGIAWFSAMLNSLIHVAMYGYYTLAALKLPCPWKKMLTMMQMAQFCLCMSTAIYALVLGVYPFYLSLLNIFVMLNMLVLFGNFYRKKYSSKGTKTELKARDEGVSKPSLETKKKVV